MNDKLREPMSDQIRRVAAAINKKTPEEKIQLLVKAGLMSQEKADKAKGRLAKKRKPLDPRYLAMIEEFPLRPITSERMYRKARQVLMAPTWSKLSACEQGYLVVLRLLIDEYEEEHGLWNGEPIKRPEPIPLEMQGKWIAWDRERLKIVAHGDTPDQCESEVVKLGLDARKDVSYQHVPFLGRVPDSEKEKP